MQMTNPTGSEGFYTIKQFADLFAVSFKTLRFYEERELLRPIRRGHLRLFTEKDRLRMSVVIKAKRFGFSLTEIWRLLEGQTGRSNTSDVQLSKEQVARQLEILTSERSRLTSALAELYGLLDDPSRPASPN